MGKGYLNCNASLPLRVTTHELDYYRAAIDTSFSHTSRFIEPNVWIRYQWDNWCREFRLVYDTKGGFAPMTSFVPYRSDEDPLYVTLGGSNLKKSYTHNLSLLFSDNRSQKNRFFSVGGKYSVTRNKMAYANIYNRSTGVRTYRMENVNGNYYTEMYLNYTFPLDKAKKLIFTVNSGYDFYHSVDLIGEENGEGNPFVTTMPQRSVVRTSLIGQAFTLRWKLHKHNLRFYASGNLHLANSSRENFENISAGDFRYGMEARLELPWDVQLATDITMYSRRGYDSKDMNTDDLVWNARLSKRFWKNRLTFMVDGFDILHQLSGTNFLIDGQGQKETCHNVIPHYVMAHLVYRLNIKPKKRPGE